MFLASSNEHAGLKGKNICDTAIVVQSKLHWHSWDRNTTNRSYNPVCVPLSPRRGDGEIQMSGQNVCITLEISSCMSSTGGEPDQPSHHLPSSVKSKLDGEEMVV